MAWRKERYDVVCPHCGGVFHETNDNYENKKAANGSMFTLKPPYSTEYRWEDFPKEVDVQMADIECPWCGGCYLDATGRVIKLVMQKGGNGKTKKVPEGKQKEGKTKGGKKNKGSK